MMRELGAMFAVVWYCGELSKIYWMYMYVFKSEYRKLLEAYFGDAVVLDPQLDLECLRIPHFYSAFYVYKYATGVSAAIALAEKVLARAPGAVEAVAGRGDGGSDRRPSSGAGRSRAGRGAASAGVAGRLPLAA